MAQSGHDGQDEHQKRRGAYKGDGHHAGLRLSGTFSPPFAAVPRGDYRTLLSTAHNLQYIAEDELFLFLSISVLKIWYTPGMGMSKHIAFCPSISNHPQPFTDLLDIY
jgi:hypothetical protein